MPGMQVNAEIHLGTRSVLEYFLSPVKKVAIELWQSSTLTPSPSPEGRGEMYSAGLAFRPISRGSDRGGAGALDRKLDVG